MANKPISHLQTPEVRAKRNKAIRAAYKRRKLLKKKQALIPLDTIPGEQPPALTYASEKSTGRRTSREESRERLDIAKALIATIYKLVK